MARLFSGYARAGGFSPASGFSRARAIKASGDEYVRGLQQAQDQRARNAQFTHNFLQQSFNIQQQQRQTFRDIEVATAQYERKLKQDLFDKQFEGYKRQIQNETDLLTSIAGISSEAAKLVGAEIKKQNDAKLEYSQNLVIQYGITGEELQQLQSMEKGLLEFESQNSPLISRLRANGASEQDISVLMQKSGFNAYGAALGTVKNAERAYDGYLTDNQSTVLTINGEEMSLISAENSGDVAGIDGLFDRHRSQFIKEYLPGFDSAFIAKHAREGFLQAESRRKKRIHTRIEDQAREGNFALEKQELARASMVSGDDGQWYSQIMMRRSGGLKSNLLPQVHQRQHEQFVDLVKTGGVSTRDASNVLNHTVFAKHLNREATYKEAFPGKAAEILDAIDTQEGDRIRTANIARDAQMEQGKNMTLALMQQFGANPDMMTNEAIEEAQRAVLATGYINGANELARLKSFTLEKVNDREFDRIYAPQKALGIFPSQNEILQARLSPAKMTAELQQRKDFEDTGMSKELMRRVEKRLTSLLSEQLSDSYGSTTDIKNDSFYGAMANAQQDFVRDFRMSYKGNPLEAENYAIDQLKKELNDPNGTYKTSQIKMLPNGKMAAQPGFVNFSQPPVAKKVSSLPRIADAHKNGVQAFQTELFVDTGRIKSFVSELNAGNNRPLPSELFSISKSLKGEVPMSEIILKQVELARQQDPSIPEMNKEVLDIFQAIEKEIDPDILSTIQRYSTPATVDRGLVASGIQPIYDRSNPYVSFGMMLEQAGVEEKYIPIFGAIMMGESSGDPATDTVKSGLDPLKKNEYSVGLLEINTLAHMDKLNKLGYTIDDLRNPVKNLKVAMLVWDEWTNVVMKSRGVSEEEARMIALDRWGAYTDGRYKLFIDDSIKAWEAHKLQQTLPTWERREHRTDAANQYIDQNNPGGWIR
tara:strand:+ start:2873 stop:5668 length:2796 start_codon:yes stop_codon:yes gene_type:complete